MPTNEQLLQPEVLIALGVVIVLLTLASLFTKVIERLKNNKN